MFFRYRESYPSENRSPIPIKEIRNSRFTLDFANDEVRYAFFEDLVKTDAKKSRVGILPQTGKIKGAIERAIPDFDTYHCNSKIGV